MIQSIVEGYGEIEAVPVLLRRLLPALGCHLEVGSAPVRTSRTQIVREKNFKDALRVAGAKSRVSAVLILFDLDKDCARDLAPKMTQWAAEEIAHLPCAIVMARQEYEAWFLAAIASLRGERRIRADAEYETDPEEKSAKGVIKRFMPQNKYDERIDQPALSALFDLGQAYRRSSSFRKLVKELCRVLTELGQTPVIPAEWLPE